MTQNREGGVAGRFYPSNPKDLKHAIESYVAVPHRELSPTAVIVPHAGYIYSGAIAGAGYACLRTIAHTIRHVVIAGTWHQSGSRGLATSLDAFATPLGAVRIDSSNLSSVRDLPQVHVDNVALESDHAVQVQLPFLQMVFSDFAIVPLLVGQSSFADVAEVLERLWHDGDTLIVVSSDLSHYHDYETAQRLDHATAEAIEQLRPDLIAPHHACGRNAIGGLLTLAKKFGWRATTVDLANSGDTGGPREYVVGYGAFVFTGQ